MTTSLQERVRELEAENARLRESLDAYILKDLEAMTDTGQVPGLPWAKCHACGLPSYPCYDPECPRDALTKGTTTTGG